MDTTTKLNPNVMYGVQCDILSKDGASHMNARATSLNGTTMKKMAAEKLFEQGKIILKWYWKFEKVCEV